MNSLVTTGLESFSTMKAIDYAGFPSPFDDSGVQYAFDSVSLGLLKACPRKYFLSMVLNWQPKTRSHHLDFGIYLHTGIETYLKLRATGTDYETAVRSAIREVLVISHGYVPGLKKGEPDKTKTRYTLVRALIAYFMEYENDNCKTVILANGKPAVELSFRFEIGEGLLLCGHLDHIVDFGGSGLFVQDHKSTGSTITGASAQYFFQGFNPDNQMSGYSTAATVAFQTPVKGIMIDAIQLMVGGVEFRRGFTHRTEAQLHEFIEGIHSYRRTAEFYHHQGFWPMNETACGNYGGCQFRGICSKSPQVREAFLRTEFTQDKPWNPLEPR